jgi:tripartite-type tricarboxylate transporter receptor subunit TctC
MWHRLCLVCLTNIEAMRKDITMRAFKNAIAAGGLLAAFFSGGEAVAAWPERTITLVVPFAPGGITDVVARVTAERLNERLKQPVIVENVVGAVGTIATARVARGDADGYTLLIGTPAQISIAPFMYNISYDPIRDFAPISVIATSPFVITVGSSVPVATLQELIALAKQKPGQITFGSAGLGSLSHLVAAQFAKTAGITLTHVPYKGIAPAFQDLVGNHIAMMSPSPVELRPFLAQGTLKPLAVTDTKRSAMVPGVPAISEILPSKAVVTWNGLLAPVKTPAAVVALLSAEIRAAEQDPIFLEKLARIGVDPIVHMPRDFERLIAEDT